MTEYTKTDPKTIQQMFGSIAKNYDRTNGILSFKLHKVWNALLVQEVAKRAPTRTIVDLCAGTGEIGFGLLTQAKNPVELYLLDFCPEMLACAKMKEPAGSHNIHYMQADAQKVPIGDETTDIVTIAYGIRNIQHPEKCIREAYRILKEDGVLGILELTQPRNRFLRFGHKIYLSKVLPLIGRFIARDKAAYEYLQSSIPQFLPSEKLQEMLLLAGFQTIESKPLTGGIATLILAKK